MVDDIEHDGACVVIDQSKAEIVQDDS